MAILQKVTENTKIGDWIPIINNNDENLNAELINKATKDEVLQSINLTKEELNGTINSTKEEFNGTINSTKEELNGSILTTKTELNKSIKSNTDKITFQGEDISDIKDYIGYVDTDVIGLQVDYENSIFKRLGSSRLLTDGVNFDKFTMYSGRKRCNVSDDGTITAWYGEASYKEDGSNGQVMVYQPKFYYYVNPLKIEKNVSTGIGYHLRKANYYISETPKQGFKIHPAFIDKNGNEIDYFLTGAYEGSIFSTSQGKYLKNDESSMDTSRDKFSSIANARPSSGSNKSFTRPAIRLLSKNRGTDWYCDSIKQVSAEQLLFIIEFGGMNSQTLLAEGLTNGGWELSPDKSCSYAALTGSTSSLGNKSGRASKTTWYPGGVATVANESNMTSFSWRGKENIWGSIWKFIDGCNLWGNGSMGGGQPYICSNYTFSDINKTPYEGAGFTVTNENGYISAMGYSEKYDWLFMASECKGNTAIPVGDYHWVTPNLNDFRLALLGGSWNDGLVAGLFCWRLSDGVGYYIRDIGGRLMYIPVHGSVSYNSSVESWNTHK